MAPIQLPTFNEERELWSRGCRFIAGVDEAGAGSWAGPVYAGAAILKPDCRLELIRDSKMLSPSQRQRAAAALKAEAAAWAVGSASAEEVDQLNIRRAGALAMMRALKLLAIQPDFVLIDAFRLPDLKLPSKSIIRGDAQVMSIAAASILAKVERDAQMEKLAELYPGYGFEKHKGYGTAAHQAALVRYGICPEHRRTYEPVRQIMARSGRP